MTALLAPAVAAALAGPAAAAAAPADPDQPLRIRMDTLSPAVVPAKGAVQVTGVVTNTSEETWQNVNLYAFSSSQPLTTEEELADAAQTDPEVEVGARVISSGTFDAVGELESEDSAGFTLRVPRSSLDIPEGQPGVYWFGVHALGTNVDGRDGIADGRARTFLTELDQGSPQLPVSLVLPLRRPVRHRADGRVDGVKAWARDLGPGGRLRALLDFGAFGSDRALTWMVDPAVLGAADQLARGNPPRSVAPTQPEPGTPNGGASPSDEASTPSGDSGPSGGSGGGGGGSGGSGGSEPSGSGGGSDGGPDGGSGDGSGSGSGGGSDDEAATPLGRRVADLADVWGLRARGLLGQGEVLALPYADLDVAAALVHQPSAYARAISFSSDSLAGAGLSSSPVFAPPGGRSDESTLDGLAKDTLTLLSEQAVENGDRVGSPVRTIAGHDVVLVDEGATAGGPGPDDPLGAVQVRQRLLAETGLHSLAGDDSPMAAVLPARWVPGDARGFFLGIDEAPWIRLATLGAATAGLTEQTDPEALDYPEEASLDRVGYRNFATVQDLTDAGELLDQILTRNDTVGDAVAREALGAASYAARHRPIAWRQSDKRSLAQVNTQLRQVRVEAPPSVTLSSEEGKFAASLVNDLDQPVTVRIEARTDGPVEVRAPESISLAPGEQTSVLLTVNTSRIGLHDVELVVTAPDGVPLGSRADLPIRSAQVSWIIWVVIAVGGTVLFGAIAVRLVRRVRSGEGVGRAPAAPEGAA